MAEDRGALFDRYLRSLHETPPDLPLRCPCCRCRTLSQPNGALSLAGARDNYRRLGACDERSVACVRPPRPDELADP